MKLDCNLEYCCKCGEPTGKAGPADDSLYDDKGNGPFCEACVAERVKESDSMMKHKTIQEYRQIQAKMDMQNGRRAYTDSFNHVLIRINGAEFGLDLTCALRLREDLDRAIRNAALSDDNYLNLCS